MHILEYLRTTTGASTSFMLPLAIGITSSRAFTAPCWASTAMIVSTFSCCPLASTVALLSSRAASHSRPTGTNPTAFACSHLAPLSAHAARHSS
ncbi:hypothetical protein BCR44DRAFT_1439204 [Catenaria anguillulae PL171]|uniref:Uncharacterized protein n=1 Tax=Catenaria anguillulae PL171 TaxID=765915 RepID=A0A1Y2HIQ7_9FUNG|nr:hypothetical protein BCR44DRAFT_1439204 [Catenaria anguillulae PL171]